jgi:hypothetical protein
VRILRHRDTLFTTAARTADCAACGSRIYGEQYFASAIQTARPDGVKLALEGLLERIARWKDEPAVCRQCPERVAVR